MLKSKYLSPLSGNKFDTHGVKELGGYTYVLLIDMSAQAVIKRIVADASEILFTFKTSGTIANFWSDPTVHEYKYLYLI